MIYEIVMGIVPSRCCTSNRGLRCTSPHIL